MIKKLKKVAELWARSIAEMIDWDWRQLQRHWFDRRAQALKCFLSALCLLPVTLNFECVAGTFAGGTQLVQSQLLWRFGFLKLEDSHAFIYGNG